MIYRSARSHPASGDIGTEKSTSVQGKTRRSSTFVSARTIDYRTRDNCVLIQYSRDLEQTRLSLIIARSTPHEYLLRFHTIFQGARKKLRRSLQQRRSSSTDRYEANVRMTQRNRAAKGASTLPTTTWPDRAPGLVGSIGYVEPIGRSEPFCPFRPSPFPIAATLREHPSSYLMTALSLATPLARASFVPRARVAGIMVRNRYAENWLARARLARARFLINISIRYFEGIYDARRHMSRMLVSAVEATKLLVCYRDR